MKENMNGLRLVATGRGNWDYYEKVFSDGSRAVMYIAKAGTGCDSGVYCGVKRLRAHFLHLMNVTGANRKSIIPEDWAVIDSGFFAALGIE